MLFLEKNKQKTTSVAYIMICLGDGLTADLVGETLVQGHTMEDSWWRPQPAASVLRFHSM